MALADVMAGMAGSGIGDGWARAGRNLARAGAGSQQQVYDEAMSRRHRLEKQLAEARIARDEDLARTETTQKLTQLTGNPDLAEALSVLVRGAGGNFDQVTQGIGNLQSQGYQRQAADLMMGGDMQAGNAALAASQGKPLELTKVTGNTAYNPYVTPSASELMTTPYGEDYLDNQRYRTDTQAATQRQRTAAKANDPKKLEEQAIKDLAQDAYYSLRADGVDMKGVTLGDIQYGLRSQGRWTAPDGSVVHFGGGDGTAPAASAAAAMGGGTPAAPPARAPVRTPAAAPAKTATSGKPPVPNARKAPDGNWYIPDPDRPGKYLRVDG